MKNIFAYIKFIPLTIGFYPMVSLITWLNDTLMVSSRENIYIFSGLFVYNTIQ